MSPIRTATLTALLIAAGLTISHPVRSEPNCNQSIGPQKAHQLVEQCLDVSPATHPPCNAANACSLIEDEIRRGCSMLGKDAPGFCKPYHAAS